MNDYFCFIKANLYEATYEADLYMAVLILCPNLKFCSILQNVRGKNKPISSLLMQSTTQSIYSDAH